MDSLQLAQSSCCGARKGLSSNADIAAHSTASACCLGPLNPTPVALAEPCPKSAHYTQACKRVARMPLTSLRGPRFWSQELKGFRRSLGIFPELTVSGASVVAEQKRLVQSSDFRRLTPTLRLCWLGRRRRNLRGLLVSPTFFGLRLHRRARRWHLRGLSNAHSFLNRTLLALRPRCHITRAYGIQALRKFEVLQHNRATPCVGCAHGSFHHGLYAQSRGSLHQGVNGLVAEPGLPMGGQLGNHLLGKPDERDPAEQGGSPVSLAPSDFGSRTSSLFRV